MYSVTVRTEIQPELGKGRWDERAGSDRAHTDGRVYVGTSVEGHGCAR